MTDWKPDESFLDALKDSADINGILYYNTERLIDSQVAGHVDEFYHACRAIQNLGSKVGSALGAQLEEVEFEGGGSRGLFRRYEDNHFLILVARMRMEKLRDKLDALQKHSSPIEQETYRGSNLLNWFFGMRPH